MPIMSAKLSHALVKATYARSVEDAFHQIFSEYLELKLSRLQKTINDFQEKWGFSFEELKKQIKNNTLKKDPYSFESEEDFWELEEAITLKEHYSTIKNHWM